MDFYTPREDDDEMVDVDLISGTTTNESRRTNAQSTYVGPAETKTPAPTARKVSGPRESGGETPVTEGMKSETPGSSKRKAAENALNKLHNEIMPDVIAWQREKNRKRIPEESQNVEEKRKAEKRKAEEKENIEMTAKKPRKDVDAVVESGSKIILLVTGAADELTSPSTIKVFPTMSKI